MPTLEELSARLLSSPTSARRIAIFDLIRLSADDPRAAAALLSHLPGETDEKSALAIIRHLADACRAEAIPILWRLYEDRTTPVRIAHAAIIAHDRLLGLQRTRSDSR